MPSYDSSDLDQILSDVKRLLSDDASVEPSQARDAVPPTPPFRPQAASGTVSDDTRMYRPAHQQRPSSAAPKTREDGVYNGEGRYEWNEPGYTGSYGGVSQPKVVRRSSSAARTATPAAERRTAAEPSPAHHAPQASRMPEQPRARYAADAARASEPSARAQQARAEQEHSARSKAQRAARQSAKEPEEMEAPPKKRHKGRRILITLLVLALLAFGAYSLVAKQPISDDTSMGARKPGVSTILLAGTDKDGTRTDTIMLLTLDSKKHTAGLVSIPRDTRVNGAYALPKINGVYGVNGGGKEGMEMLMQRVAESVGFWPDGYLLVDLDKFVDLVNIMGGVDFNVPMDMYYNDPSQNLYIDLKAGEQHLDGTQSMGLVRFRSGYAMADLERVNVQRDFVAAAADQWIKPTVVLKTPRLLAWFSKNVTTDLSTGNMTWIAMALMRADASAIATKTLPGTPSGNFYVLSPYDVVETVNSTCNPYARDITVDDLTIRN